MPPPRRTWSAHMNLANTSKLALGAANALRRTNTGQPPKNVPPERAAK
jgi:hypothetical protein